MPHRNTKVLRPDYSLRDWVIQRDKHGNSFISGLRDDNVIVFPLKVFSLTEYDDCFIARLSIQGSVYMLLKSARKINGAEPHD